MRIFLAIIGAFMKWLLKGFRGKFMEELYGEDVNQKVRLPKDSNIYLGMLTLLLLGIIFSML